MTLQKLVKLQRRSATTFQNLWNCRNERTAKNDVAKTRETTTFQKSWFVKLLKRVKRQKWHCKINSWNYCFKNYRSQTEWTVKNDIAKNSWNYNVRKKQKILQWLDEIRQVKVCRLDRKLAFGRTEIIIRRLLRWFLYFLTIYWLRSSSGTLNSDVNDLNIR